VLPVINLDDQYFEDIVEEAKKMIPAVYPNWTDYNEHDPGITFLELFAWLKESQQYHMNQIGRDNYLLYLNLLGIKLLKRRPATALVTFLGVETDFALSKGSRMYAGDICFETTEKENLSSIHIVSCEVAASGKKAKIGYEIINSGSNMRLHMFGEEPADGDEFIICFDKAFKAGSVYSIYFSLSDDYPVERNPINEDFVSLAKLSLMYYGDGGWKECEVIKDETHAMIQSGKLYFIIPAAMKEDAGRYLLKLKLSDCCYDVPPVLNSISMNVIKVVQTETLSEYEDISVKRSEEGNSSIVLDSYLARKGLQDIFVRINDAYIRCTDVEVQKQEGKAVINIEELFEKYRTDELNLRIVSFCEEFEYKRCHDMNGLPYQSIELDDGDVYPDSLKILVEDEINPDTFVEWKQVDTFYCSGETDPHYRYDENSAKIIFGDCENGKAPEGRLIIIGYKRTKAEGGNVKSMQINLLTDGPDSLRLYNKDNAYGGREAESIDECFARFLRESKTVKRAVTNEDYETMIRKTPGLMIANVKVIPVSDLNHHDFKFDDLTVTAVVQPYTAGKRKPLNKAYLSNIYNYLEDKKLIGSRLNVLSPEYVAVSVLLEVAVKPQYINAYDMVKAAVMDYFDKFCNDFGKPVRYSELYGIVDVLECVKQVQSLTINTMGRRIKRSMYGDLLMPVNGLAYLGDLKISVITMD